MRFKLIILAIFLRLLVALFLFHPDIKTIAFQTSFLKQGVVNIYSYLSENKQHLPLKEEFVYFPLTYFVIGGYQAVISSVLGDAFNNWLYDAGTVSTPNNPNIFIYLIFLKLPLLLMDLFIAFLLPQFFRKEADRKKVFNLWLFNPFTIILIYAFSNIDLYVVLLTIIALLYIKKEKIIKAVFFIGFAASFKLYPLLFVPFFFLKAKNVKEKILTVMIPTLIFVLTIIPFFSTSFINSALISGLSTRIFNPSFMIGFGESIMIGLFLLSSLFFYGLVINKKTTIFNYVIIVLFILFSFSHYHISWLLWIAPLLVVLAIKKPSCKWIIFIWALFSILIPLFYQDRSMTYSLYRIYTSWFDLLPIPFTIVEKFYDPYAIQSMIHSLLAGLSTIIGYKLLIKK